MTRIFSLLAAATVALGVSTLRAEDKKPYTDSEFVAKAASGGLHEVEMGKLASERAKRQEVKDFGKKMAEDHGKANMALKTAAASAGIIIVEKQNEEHQKMYDKFKAMTGGDFDAEYIKHMKHDHEMDIKEFTQASKESKNAAIREFAANTLPVVQSHAELLKKMDQ